MHNPTTTVVFFIISFIIIMVESGGFNGFMDPFPPKTSGSSLGGQTNKNDSEPDVTQKSKSTNSSSAYKESYSYNQQYKTLYGSPNSGSFDRQMNTGNPSSRSYGNAIPPAAGTSINPDTVPEPGNTNAGVPVPSTPNTSNVPEIANNTTTQGKGGKRVRSYYLSDIPFTWYESKRYCDSAGMELLSIETPDENIHILGLLESAGVALAWTSGTDVVTKGQYVWASPKITFNYSYWIINQAPNDTIRGCVFIGINQFWAQQGFNRSGWYVQTCSTALRFICE